MSRQLSSWHCYTEVSWNRGTPKSSIEMGFSIINHPFWGSIYGNHHIPLWLRFFLLLTHSYTTYFWHTHYIVGLLAPEQLAPLRSRVIHLLVCVRLEAPNESLGSLLNIIISSPDITSFTGLVFRLLSRFPWVKRICGIYDYLRIIYVYGYVTVFL